MFYGAPDDHAWTDASHAIKEAANAKDEGPDLSVSVKYSRSVMLIWSYIQLVGYILT